MPWEAFQERLGYSFRNIELLQRALTHASLPNEAPDRRSNERLEFLGDAVLELAVRDALFRAFPERREGWMTTRKREIVRNQALAEAGRALRVGEVLEMGKGQRKRGIYDSMRANTFEALLGAIFMDSDYETAARVALQHVTIN